MKVLDFTKISIHALRKESDVRFGRIRDGRENFNPRSP